jgi:hypothetical protein
MQARNNERNSAARRQERLDVTSQVVGAGSSYDSSDDELELEDPVVTAERQQQLSQKLDAFVGAEGPWSVYNQRRQSETTARALMAEKLRALEQQYSPSRRSTTPN